MIFITVVTFRQFKSDRKPSFSYIVNLSKKLYSFSAQAEPLDDLVDLFRFLHGSELELFVDDYIGVDIGMYEIVVRAFFAIVFESDQAMLLDPSEPAILLLKQRLVILPFEVSLDPANILTPLKPPLLEQFPAIIKMLLSDPQEHERGDIRQRLDLKFSDLGHRPGPVFLGGVLVHGGAFDYPLVFLPGRVD
jgi:hypothetical protein